MRVRFPDATFGRNKILEWAFWPSLDGKDASPTNIPAPCGDVTPFSQFKLLAFLIISTAVLAEVQQPEEKHASIYWGSLGPRRGLVVDASHVFVTTKKGLSIIPKTSFTTEGIEPARLALKGIPQPLVLLNGKRALAGTGQHIAVIDIEDRKAPKLIAKLRVADDDLYGCEDFELRGKTLYVASRRKGLLTVDVSNPAQPKIKNRLKLPGMASGISLDGDIACVAVDTGIAFVDISGKRPKKISYLDTLRSALSVDSARKHAVIASLNYIEVIDYSNPKKPKSIREGVHNAPFWYAGFRDITLREHLAYMATGEGGLYIFDWSTGPKCKLVAQMGFWGGGRTKRQQRIEYVKKFGIAKTDKEAAKYIPEGINYYFIGIALAVDNQQVYVLGHVLDKKRDDRVHCMRFTETPSPDITYISNR